MSCASLNTYRRSAPIHGFSSQVDSQGVNGCVESHLDIFHVLNRLFCFSELRGYGSLYSRCSGRLLPVPVIGLLKTLQNSLGFSLLGSELSVVISVGHYYLRRKLRFLDAVY